MPRYVTDKILIEEVCFQMPFGFSKVLTNGNKKPRPTLPLTIATCIVKDFREVEAEAEEMKIYHLESLDHWTYDPERIIPDHCKQAKFKWNYQHTECSSEYKIRNWYNVDMKLAPGVWSDQEDPDDKTLEDRSRELGGASSSQAKRPRASTGHSTSTQHK